MTSPSTRSSSSASSRSHGDSMLVEEEDPLGEQNPGA